MMRQGIATIRENELTGGPPREQNVTSLPTARTEEEWVNSFEFPPTMEEIQGIRQPYSLKHEGAPYESGYDTKREAFWERMRSAPTLEGWDTEEERARYLGAPSGIETLGTMEDAPMIPDGGIQGALPEAIEMLEAAGRNGDVRIVHTEDGDTVVPKEVFEGPGGQPIRESLVRQMAQLGVDPERYVVGGGLNSINPETGLPEFFFKKIFKSIKKIFKQVAPIILPIVLTPFIGPIAAGVVGSGIGTLIQGGSAKDALKAAAFGGITAGVMSGISAKAGMSGPGVPKTFWGGVQAGLPDAFGGQGIIPWGEGTKSVLFSDVDKFGGQGKTPWYGRINTDNTVFGSGQSPNAQATVAPKAQAKVGSMPRGLPWGDQSIQVGLADDTLPLRPTVVDPMKDIRRIPGQPLSPTAKAASNLQNIQNQTGAAMPEKSWLNRNLFEGAGDFVPEGFGGTTKLEYALRNNPAEQAYIDKIKGLVATKDPTTGKPLMSPEKAQLLIAERLQGRTNYKQWLGPLTAAGIGTYLAGGFEAEQAPDLQSRVRPIDPKLVAMNRIFRPGATPEELRAPAKGPIDLTPYQFSPNQVRFTAHGGEMQNFPPRIGAISGPGTGTSDDVPAMLSDGEFVMTAQAVRGAGNGSRRQGVKNLYDIMRNFEAVA